MVGHRKTLFLGLALLASAFVVGCSARAESRQDDQYGHRQEQHHRRRSNRSHEHRYNDRGYYNSSFSVGVGSD